MDVDVELDAWRREWQSEEKPHGDLRLRVARETGRMRRSVIWRLAVSVIYGGGTAGWALSSRQGDAYVLAIGIWVMIALGWAVSFILQRGAWRPVMQTTRAFLDLAVLRCRRSRMAIVVQSVSYAVVLTFLLSWIYSKSYRSQPISGFLLSGSLIWVWIVTASFAIFAVRRWHRLGGELQALTALRQEIL